MKQLAIIVFLGFSVWAFAQDETAPAAQNFNLSQGLRFEENKGQVADTDGNVRSDILFTMKDKGMTLFFRKDGISYQWYWLEELMDGPYRISEATGRPVNEDDALPQKFKKPKPTRLHTYRVDMQWLGAGSNVKIISEGVYEDYNNYYHAHCPDGITGVKSYSKLIYKNMYPNVDIVYYVKEGKLKYDVLVHEGGDVRKAKFVYKGTTPKLIDGKLRIETPLGYLEEQKPVSFDKSNGKIEIQFGISKDKVGFEGNRYTSAFTIDPEIVWASYYGGSSSDVGNAIATNVSGVYIAGGSYSTTSIASSGHQNTIGGQVDAFLVRFNSSGIRQWGTYYGGTGVDIGSGVAVNSDAVYLCGSTTSGASISSGGHQNTHGGSYDGFLVKFSYVSGTRVWATYYGSTGQDYAESIALESNGEIYLSGTTNSSSGIAGSPYFQGTIGGGDDAFLAKFNSSGVRQWATYYGGSGNEVGASLTIDGNNSIILSGKTTSTSNISSTGSYQTALAGNADGFVVKFLGSGSRLWATYFGGSGNDGCEGVTVDASNNVYITGYTSSTTSVASGGFQNSYGGGPYDAFIAKFNLNGSFQWSSYLGGSGDDRGTTVSYGDSRIFLAGYTNSTSGVATNWFQTTLGSPSHYDGFFTKLALDGTREWSTYYGGWYPEFILDAKVGGAGEFYIVGKTQSTDLTIVDGHQSTYGGNEDAFFARFNGRLSERPGSQPTDMSFANPTSTSLSVSFVNAQTEPLPDQYIAIARKDSPPTSDPLDGTTYYVGQSLGDGVVAFRGNSTVFVHSGLESNSIYYYKIYSLKHASGSSPNYLESSPLVSSRTTLATEPTAQPTALTFPTFGETTLDGSFTAATGSPAGYLVLRRAGASPTGIPVDGTTYSVGNTIGDGTVVSVGSSTTYNDTGLSANTVYHYDVFSYNGSGDAINYRTTSPLEGSRTTLATEPTAQPTALTFPTFGETTLGGSFTAASGSPSGYLVLRRQGASPTGIPVDGATYSVGNTIGDGTVVSVGSGTTFNDTGLLPNTIYHYDIFSYNGSGDAINYRTTSPHEGSRTTLATEPTAQPTALTFPTFGETTLGGSFTAASGSPSGYLVLRRQGASPTGIPVDGATYSVGNTIGDGTVVSVGSGTTFNDTGLLPNTIYHYDIFSYNGAGDAINYRTTSPLEGSRTTLATEPTAQPTALAFPTFSETTLGGSFTAASGSPAGYLVLRRASASPTGIPVDGTTYTVGTVIGDGTIVAVGSGTTFNDTGLSANTVYHYDIFSYNGSGAAINYRTASPLENNRTTLATEPTAQPTALTFPTFGETTLGGSFTAASGSPAGYLVLRRAGASPTGIPVDGTTYTVGTVIGDGTVVAVGSGTTFNDTGLSANMVYHYDIFSYNGSGLAINYRTASPLENNRTTLATEPTAQPTSLAFPTFSETTLGGSFTAASGSPAGYLVLRRAGASPTGTPVDGTTYSVGNTIGDGTVVSVGSGTTFNDTGLSANTVYHYDIFSYNGSGLAINYRTVSPLENNRTTLAIQPSAQPTAPGFSLQTTTTLRLSYTAASGSPTGYLIIRKAGAASTGVPVDGTFYSVGNSLDGTIVAIGNFTQFDDTGLSAGTVYHYTVFSYNGAGQAVNYLTSSPLQGSTITLPVAPTALAATGVQQFQFTANWSSVTGAANYLLDVSSDNFSTFVSGYNAKTVTGTSDAVTGLTAGITYQYRVRAANASGQSVNSNTISQITVPPTPVGVNSTGAEQTQFTVSWTASLGAVDYLLDVSLDNFATFVTGYNGKVITGTSENVTTGLIAGNTYQVRVRARNAGGTSPNSSAVTQMLKPATPLALDANPIGINSFTAKWDPANGAASYTLDVSTQSDFSTHLPGYPNNEGNTLEKLITGLTANSSYYYRVKSVNATGESPYSNVKPVQTQPDPGGLGLVIGSITFNNLATGESAVSVSAEVTGGTGTKTVQLLHRKITNTGAHAPISMANPSGNNTTFVVDLSASALDELGAEFFIRASDASANPAVNSATQYIYRSFTDLTSQTIPSIVRHGGTQKSYQIISIPLVLTKNGIADIFEPVPELGAYDKTKWRLVRFQNNKNTDYKEGINAIERGKSYWFNSVGEVAIKTGAGTTPNNNQSAPFSMPLAQGWNQIATPYPFAIDWDDVLAANGNPAVGNYKVFNSNQLSFDVVNSMKPFEGGFVFADNAVPSLSFPVTLKNTAGGRMKQDEELSKNIDSETWLLPFKLVQEDVVNELGGIGMHPQASLSKDRFDDVTVPRFVQYLESNFYHPEFFWPKFSRDVVPTTEEYEWNLVVESNGSGPIELRWNAGAIANAQSALYLVDEEDARILDMRKESSFAFSNTDRKELKLVYTHKGEYMPNRTRLGTPWPNPASREVNIPFILAESNTSYRVEVDVFDLKGVKVATLSLAQVQSGAHVSVWDTRDGGGSEVSNAIYIIKLNVNGRYLPEFSRVVVNRKQ